MKRILIAGGAGFIGTHLCRRMLAEGNEVICLDDLSSGSYENIRDLLEKDRFTFIQQDVIDPVEVAGPLDRIYDLACQASPVQYQKDPVHTARTSVLGACNLLDLARHTGARILLTSTSETYGEPLVHPQPESYRGNVNSIGIRSCYDEGKRMAETLFFDYHRQYGTDIRVVRLFNTYGPGMLRRDGRVVSNFILQALSGKPITIYGDGLQTRCLCYVDDTLEAIVRMMETDGITGPVNIGNPVEMTVKEIADLVLDLSDSRSGIVYMARPQDDPTRRCPDITLAGRLLGWAPTISPREGLRRTIEYFRDE